MFKDEDSFLNDDEMQADLFDPFSMLIKREILLELLHDLKKYKHITMEEVPKHESISSIMLEYREKENLV